MNQAWASACVEKSPQFTTLPGFSSGVLVGCAAVGGAVEVEVGVGGVVVGGAIVGGGIAVG